MFADLAGLQIDKLRARLQPARPKPVARSAKPQPPAYTLEALVTTMYAADGTVARSKPQAEAEARAVFEKGERINVIARVKGLREDWLQALSGDKQVFIPAAAASDEAPAKSMAELIMESKAEMGYDTAAGVSDYRQRQCLKNCESQAYMGMDSTTLDNVKEACALSMNSAQEQLCLQQAKDSWRKSQLTSCTVQCNAQ